MELSLPRLMSLRKLLNLPLHLLPPRKLGLLKVTLCPAVRKLLSLQLGG